jgi:hypothetical protein
LQLLNFYRELWGFFSFLELNSKLNDRVTSTFLMAKKEEETKAGKELPILMVARPVT